MKTMSVRVLLFVLAMAVLAPAIAQAETTQERYDRVESEYYEAQTFYAQLYGEYQDKMLDPTINISQADQTAIEDFLETGRFRLDGDNPNDFCVRRMLEIAYDRLQTGGNPTAPLNTAENILLNSPTNGAWTPLEDAETILDTYDP